MSEKGSLIDLYNTGKYKTDKGTSHAYIEGFYSKKFNDPNKKIRLLEIGILEGESLKLWRDYFVNGEIWGIDKTVQKMARAIDGCFIVLGDAYNPKYVEILPYFDVVIDDGMHTIECHKKVIDLYSQKTDCIIIEDIQNFDYVSELVRLCPKGWSVQVHDLREVKGRFDDVIVCYDRDRGNSTQQA